MRRWNGIRYALTEFTRKLFLRLWTRNYFCFSCVPLLLLARSHTSTCTKCHDRMCVCAHCYVFCELFFERDVLTLRLLLLPLLLLRIFFLVSFSFRPVRECFSKRIDKHRNGAWEIKRVSTFAIFSGIIFKLNHRAANSERRECAGTHTQPASSHACHLSRRLHTRNM